MDRKLDQLEKFLIKGHRCTVAVRCPGRLVRLDEQTLERFIKQLQQTILERGREEAEVVLISKPEMNEARTQGKMKFERRAKK